MCLISQNLTQQSFYYRFIPGFIQAN